MYNVIFLLLGEHNWLDYWIVLGLEEYYKQNIKNKKLDEPARTFRDLWSLVLFLKFSKLEKFQNITRAHKSRNALSFIQFPKRISSFLISSLDLSHQLTRQGWFAECTD